MEAKSAGFLIISGSQTRARMRRSRVRSRRSRRYLGILLRYMDRRAERDNHARQEQRRRNAAKNVGADFAFSFHGYISVLRRDGFQWDLVLTVMTFEFGLVPFPL